MSTYKTFSLAEQMSTSQPHLQREARRGSEMHVHVPPPPCFNAQSAKLLLFCFPSEQKQPFWVLSGSEACIQGCCVYLAQLSNGCLEYHKDTKIQLPIYVFTWYKRLMD